MELRRYALVAVLTLATWLGMPTPAYAASATWDGGAGDGLWSSAANWSGDVLPTASSIVTISGAGVNATLDTDFTVGATGGITIGWGATLTVASGHTLTLSGGDQLSNNVSSGGKLRNEGSIVVTTRLNIGGRLENAAGATVDMNGQVEMGNLPTDESVANDGTVNVRGYWSQDGIFRNRATFNLLTGALRMRGLANYGTFHNTATGTFTGAAGTTIQVGDPQWESSDTMINDGAATFPGTLTVNRTMTNNGTFNNTGGSTTIVCGATIRGTGTFTPGTLSEGCKLWTGDGGDGLWSNPLNWSLHILPDGTKDVRIDANGGAKTVTLDTDFTLGTGHRLDVVGWYPTTNTITIPTGRTLTIGTGATLANDYSHVINNGTIVNNGTLKNEGHININVATFDNAGTITNNGTLTNASSAYESITGYAQFGIFNNTGSIANPGTIENINGTWRNPGTIANTGTFRNHCGTVLQNTGTITGNAVVQLCATWDGGAGDGLWSSAANWSGDVLPTASSIVTISGAGVNATLDTDFTVGATGGITIGWGATLTVASGHTLTLSGGDQLSNNVSSGGKLRNEGSIVVTTRLNIGGRLENAAGATVDMNGQVEMGNLPTDESVANDGTVNVRGYWSQDGIFRNRATFNLLTGALRMRGLANYGTFHNTATGTFTGAAGTTIQVGDPQWESSDTMINDGAATFPGTLTVNRTMTNNGTFNNTGGSTTIVCGATIRGTGTFTPGTLSEGCKLWTGDGGDGLWSNPLNWSLHILPDGTKDVRIDANGGAKTVTLDTDFTLGTGHRLDVVGWYPTTNTITIPTGRTLTIGTGATLANDYSHVINNGTIVNNGTLKNEGHININVATFDNAGTITNNGTLTNASSAYESITGYAQFGIFNNTGSIANPGTTRNINGTWNNRGLIGGTGVLDNNSLWNDACGSLITGTQLPAGTSVVVTLCTPTPTAPAANASVTTANPAFSWSNVSERRAVSYEWQLLGATGTAVLASGASATTSFTPTASIADGAYRWRVRAVLGSASATSTETAFGIDTNVAPVVDSATLPATVAEGSPADLALAFHDDDPGDTHSVTIAWGDGSTDTVPSATSPLAGSHAYADGPATRTVVITVTDAAGESASVTRSISVTNVAPTVAAGPDVSIIEGATFSGTGGLSDPGADSWTANVDYGDGSGLALLRLTTAKTFALGHTYPENGAYDVRVCVTDDDGGMGCDIVRVTVTNAAPVVEAGADQTANEGSLVSVNATFTDAGVLDTHTTAIDWGDGATSSGTSGTHIYADNGAYTVTVTVTDDDGAVGSDTLLIGVANVAPTVNAGPAGTTVEGTPFLRTASFTDPGADSWSATVDYGDGAGPQTVSIALALSHTYADDGTYTVTICVTDDDGGIGCAGFVVTVSNAAPVVDAGPDQTANEGSPVTIGATYVDAGVLDTHAARIDWGDGASTNAIAGSHAYDDNGSYLVTVTVTDDDGGVGTDTLLVTVANVGAHGGRGRRQVRLLGHRPHLRGIGHRSERCRQGRGLQRGMVLRRRERTGAVSERDAHLRSGGLIPRDAHVPRQGRRHRIRHSGDHDVEATDDARLDGHDGRGLRVRQPQGSDRGRGRPGHGPARRPQRGPPAWRAQPDRHDRRQRRGHLRFGTVRAGHVRRHGAFRRQRRIQRVAVGRSPRRAFEPGQGHGSRLRDHLGREDRPGRARAEDRLPRAHADRARHLGRRQERVVRRRRHGRPLLHRLRRGQRRAGPDRRVPRVDRRRARHGHDRPQRADHARGRARRSGRRPPSR